MPKNFLVLDIATAPIPDAAQFINDAIQAPANYKDQAKIDAYIAEKRQEQADRAGLDLDLCRISGVGMQFGDAPEIMLCKTESDEAAALKQVGKLIQGQTLIGFNSLKFDWPILMRRARYLGVSFPKINLDRYRSEHLDLFNILTNSGALPGHSLKFYAARLGWLDLEKPSDGAMEARVFETGKWDELEQSIRHDVIATARLAQWLGVTA